MDEIQKVLIKEGRKDLAQKYYKKIAGTTQGKLSDIIQAFNDRADDLISGAYGKNGGDLQHPQAAKIKAVAVAICGLENCKDRLTADVKKIFNKLNFQIIKL